MDLVCVVSIPRGGDDTAAIPLPSLSPFLHYGDPHPLPSNLHGVSPFIPQNLRVLSDGIYLVRP